MAVWHRAQAAASAERSLISILYLRRERGAPVKHVAIIQSDQSICRIFSKNARNRMQCPLVCMQFSDLAHVRLRQPGDSGMIGFVVDRLGEHIRWLYSAEQRRTRDPFSRTSVGGPWERWTSLRLVL